jgi:tetratricopeptide (TPR) repeat protein
LSEAIRLDPDDADARDRRGVAYKHKGDYQKALDDFTEAIRLDPGSAQAYRDRADCRLARCMAEPGIADFLKKWNTPDGHDAILRVCEAEGGIDAVAEKLHTTEGINDFLKKCGVDGRVENVSELMGQVEQGRKDVSEAIKRIIGAQVLATLSVIHSDMGDRDQANADLEKAAQLDATLAEEPPPPF